MKRLQEKRALITGGTTGIGLETARLFLEEGARAMIAGSKRESVEKAAITNVETLEKCYFTAMLLTGSSSLAEAAVLQAIESSDGGPIPPLLCRTVNAALRLPHAAGLFSLVELESEYTAIPDRQRAILSLPLLPRQCFVLRILLSLPHRECALLLNIPEGEVRDNSAKAASLLAQKDLPQTHQKANGVIREAQAR